MGNIGLILLETRQHWIPDIDTETRVLVFYLRVTWEGLGAGGEGDDRGWDGWMASLTWWTWVWVNSRSWWWTGRPGVLQFMGSQRVRHDWAIELNWCLLLVIVPILSIHLCRISCTESWVKIASWIMVKYQHLLTQASKLLSFVPFIPHSFSHLTSQVEEIHQNRQFYHQILFVHVHGFSFTSPLNNNLIFCLTF